jgi:hypothetical protein
MLKSSSRSSTGASPAWPPPRLQQGSTFCRSLQREKASMAGTTLP